MYCLCLVWYSYCGVRDPSWSEIRHFVEFLNLQLHSSERSYFTDPEFVGDVIAGFKSFVVKFMIRMSRVSLYLCESHLPNLMILLTLGFFYFVSER